MSEPTSTTSPPAETSPAQDSAAHNSPAADSAVDSDRPTDRQARSRLISSGAVMAAGTAVSRLLGFGRFVLLVILFGNGTRQADMFTLANTVPNSMYILLAGGVLNTVLVPQIVRAVKKDADRGEAYTNRIMTLGLMALFVITLVLTLAAPAIIALYSAGGWKDPSVAAQYQSMVALAYYCMPQVFFYGAFVLAGQVLNSRDRFGPMMWAPIANNVVSIAVLLLFLVTFGATDTSAAFSPGQEALLGIGSTVGVAAQAAILVPYLRSSGYQFQPRFDFRHTGLGHTLRLAKWVLGYVLVTQLALIVVNKVATAATLRGDGGGIAAYGYAYAIWILPHSLITVSLATAMLPSASRLAAAGDLRGVAEETTRTMRLALSVLVPTSVAFVVLGLPIARLIFGFGAGAEDWQFTGYALMALGIGLVPFTLQYVCLRAFYALENTRTPFLIQVVIAGANVLIGVGVVVALDSAPLVAAGLALGYSLAYVLGVGISFRRLQKTLPALALRPIVGLILRTLVATAPAALAAWLILRIFDADSQLLRALALAVAGVIAVILYAVAARLLRIGEVTDIVATVLRRGPRGDGPGSPPGGGTDDGNPTAAVAEEAIEAEEAAAITGAAGTRGVSETPAMRTMPDDSGDFGDSTAPRPGSSPTIGASADPTPVAGPTENADPMVTFAGASRMSGPASAPPAAPGPTDVLGGVPATPHQASEMSDEDATSDGNGGADSLTPDTSPSTLPRITTSAGTVLGYRYRMEELLAESSRSLTWRAFDLVLSRSVVVHLLAPLDPEAPDILETARRASLAVDSRFLRVLDAVHSDDPELGSYVVCEYAVGRSLEVLLSHGPLSGLESAWVVREVADALSGVHGLGLYHQRINPDTVILTPDGHVKIVGLLIEAALRPAPGNALPRAPHLGPEQADVVDLGRLLYACLVSRWPGGPAFSLPAAPVAGRHLMSPRQVRAGVSPALDVVCDQILGDPPRHRAVRLASANEVVNALTKVLGSADASADLERRLRQPIPKVTSTPPITIPLHARSAGSSTSPITRSALSPSHGESEDSVRVTLIRQPTPPPPNRPQRRAGSKPVPGRPRRWLALVAAMGLLLLATGIGSAVILNQREGSSPPGQQESAGQPSSGPVAGPLQIAGVRTFDPQGDPPNDENNGEAKLAIDGNPETRWRTVKYLGNPKLGGLKRGVGLIVDLGEPVPVNGVNLRLSGNGTNLEIRVPKTDPASVTKPPIKSDSQWRTVGKQAKAGSSATISLQDPVTTRFVLVYLTSLPKEGGGYRGGIYEVGVV
ncbi:MAG TPA: murein biosynthesis integral membrane protein MurJ [Microlunatus sp.]